VNLYIARRKYKGWDGEIKFQYYGFSRRHPRRFSETNSPFDGEWLYGSALTLTGDEFLLVKEEYPEAEAVQVG